MPVMASSAAPELGDVSPVSGSSSMANVFPSDVLVALIDSQRDAAAHGKGASEVDRAYRTISR